MELVEGKTLAERIAKGPVPIDEAIPLFTQIAEGLEAAHEKNIIHCKTQSVVPMWDGLSPVVNLSTVADAEHPHASLFFLDRTNDPVGSHAISP